MEQTFDDALSALLKMNHASVCRQTATLLSHDREPITCSQQFRVETTVRLMADGFVLRTGAELHNLWGGWSRGDG
jgi:hypothetical protein